MGIGLSQIIITRSRILALLGIWVALGSSCALELIGSGADVDVGGSEGSAPSILAYDIDDVTYINGISSVSVLPSSSESGLEFSISPSLPAGMTFDASTGAISGTPTVTSARQLYTITASNSGGSINYTFYLRVAAGFEVNDSTDTDDADGGVDGVCEIGPGNGRCTLRAAITESNSQPGTQVIKILANVTAVTGGVKFDLDDNTEIVGESRTTSIVSGDDSSRIFHVTTNEMDLTLENLSIVDGSVVGAGGAVAMLGGDLTIKNVTFTGNDATAGSGLGGAIYMSNNFGAFVTNLYIYDSIFDSNTANNNLVEGGGAISGGMTNVIIERSKFVNNSQTHAGGVAGAILFYGGTIDITDTLFEGNTSAYGGGAVVIWDGLTTFTNVTFSENIATNDYGGALTFVNNSLASFVNCTFYGNTSGAGINATGAILLNGPGTLTFTNTIFEDNQNSGGPDTCNSAGTMTSLGYNLIDDSGADCGLAAISNDIVNTTANLQALDADGTHPINPSSPAYNAGDDGTCSATDARGVTRPQNGQCDIGAFELE